MLNQYVNDKGENMLMQLFDLCVSNECREMLRGILITNFAKNAILMANTAQDSEEHEKAKKEAKAVVFEMVTELVGKQMVNAIFLLEYRVLYAINHPSELKFLLEFQKTHPKHLYKFPKPWTKIQDSNNLT